MIKTCGNKYKFIEPSILTINGQRIFYDFVSLFSFYPSMLDFSTLLKNEVHNHSEILYYTTFETYFYCISQFYCHLLFLQRLNAPQLNLGFYSYLISYQRPPRDNIAHSGKLWAITKHFIQQDMFGSKGFFLWRGSTVSNCLTLTKL